MIALVLIYKLVLPDITTFVDETGKQADRQANFLSREEIRKECYKINEEIDRQKKFNLNIDVVDRCKVVGVELGIGKHTTANPVRVDPYYNSPTQK